MADNHNIRIYQGGELLEEIKIKAYRRGTSFSGYCRRQQTRLIKALANWPAATHARIGAYKFDGRGMAINQAKLDEILAGVAK